MEMVKGWSKSFSSGAKSTSIPVLIMVIAWIVGAIFPINLFAGSLSPFNMDIFLVAAAFYFSFVIQVYWISYRIGNFSVWASILYPIPLAFFIIVFLCCCHVVMSAEMAFTGNVNGGFLCG